MHGVVDGITDPWALDDVRPVWLEQVVFNIMGGIKEEQRTGNDLAYEIMVLITVVSVYAAPVFLIAYGGLVWRRRRRAKPGGGAA